MSTLKVTTITDQDGNNSIAQSTVFSGTAKAWSNLNGTGTIAERDSYNISSYTDNGTGQYEANLTAAMSDANFSISIISSLSATNGGRNSVTNGYVASSSIIESFHSRGSNSANEDPLYVHYGAMGDLA